MFETFKATRRLKELEERLENVERGFKKLSLEWEDAYDKLRVIVQRVVKRAQIVEKAQEEAEEQEPDTPMLPGLTPTQMERQRSILARRSRVTGREM